MSKSITKRSNKMNDLILGSNETMSHNQIAELVKSRPDTVKSSIERLSEKGIISYTPVAGRVGKNGVSANLAPLRHSK